MAFGSLCLYIMRAIAKNNYEELCKLLREHAKNIGLPEGTSLLLIACAESNGIIAVKYLIEKANMDVNFLCPKLEMTPLFMACKKGHIEIVKYLLQHPDIDPNKKVDDSGLVPLHVTIVRPPKIEIIKLLLDNKKTDVNPLDLDNNKKFQASPFMALIFMRQFEIADLLVKDKRFKVKNVLKQGETELHAVLDAAYTDEKLRFEHIKKLVAAGADPTIRQDQRHFNYKDNRNAIEAARDNGLNNIADYLENVRLEQSNNRYKSFRAQDNNGLDKNWQENPDRIHDSIDGFAQYVAELRTSI